jgi:hypothetical protein
MPTVKPVLGPMLALTTSRTVLPRSINRNKTGDYMITHLHKVALQYVD